MRTYQQKALGAALMVLLGGCSGGGSSAPDGPNIAPVADAGADASAVEGDLVTLDGSASGDADGSIVSYEWTQTSGPSAVLSGADTASLSVQTPDISAAVDLVFQLTVRDDRGSSSVDTATIALSPSDVRVFTAAGAVEGESLGGDLRVFRSIAYAEPPLGERRWRAPEPKAAFVGVTEAKTFTSNCWQLANPYAPGDSDADDVSEDCLYLNVWTPDPAPAAGAPVMVWIHGGGNIAGSADKALYDGETLAREHGVVVVSMKYRLGPLGYLAHSALNAEAGYGSSGNYGLLDIIEALTWVETNIAAFGGDPDEVTIFGESGGAVNVCNMIASPLAAGLFDRAIMQSGACSDPTQDLLAPTDRSDESAVETGDRAAEALGCSGAADVLACMRDVSAADLFSLLDLAADRFFDSGDVYQPITDGYVLPEAPLDRIASGAHNSAPLLIGSNADEAGLWLAPITALITSVASYELVVESIYDDDANFIPDGPSADVLAMYPASTDEEAVDAFMDLFTDASFTCSARRAARAMEAHAEPVWRYEFTRVPAAFSDYGAFHGAEIAYAFGTLDSPAYTALDEALSADMRAYWANFAVGGDPNGGALPVWPEFLAPSEGHVVLDQPIGTDAWLREEKCDLLDSLSGTP